MKILHGTIDFEPEPQFAWQRYTQVGDNQCIVCGAPVSIRSKRCQPCAARVRSAKRLMQRINTLDEFRAALTRRGIVRS